MFSVSRDLHPDYRDETEAVLAALQDEYEAVPLRAVEVFDRPGDRSMGFATGDHAINLNSFWFARPRRFFLDAVVEARRTTPLGLPLWHGGIGGVEGEYSRLLVHEFAHLVASVTPGSATFAKRGFQAAKDDPSIAPSGYSLVDPDEWFAEVFCAMHIGDAHSPQVEEMREFLEAA